MYMSYYWNMEKHICSNKSIKSFVRVSQACRSFVISLVKNNFTCEQPWTRLKFCCTTGLGCVYQLISAHYWHIQYLALDDWKLEAHENTTFSLKFVNNSTANIWVVSYLNKNIHLFHSWKYSSNCITPFIAYYYPKVTV
jgi:hypothetical protein